MEVQDKKEYPSLFPYWRDELEAAQKTLEKWQKQADRIALKYVGRGSRSQNTDAQTQFRLNLFHSNVETIKSMLYGDLPKVDVSRRYADSKDDVGRVAAETMERLLNLDMDTDGQEIDATLRATLFDRLTSGLGVARIRYDVTTENGQMVDESAPIDYVFWGDALWSWARNFSDLRWVAFKNYLTKEEVTERFSEAIAEQVAYKKQKVSADKDHDEDPDMNEAWMKAEIWEIWDKEEKQVHWLTLEGYDKLLETKPDPLKLRNFFPTPPFFLANPTTALYIPTPDYSLSQDLYNQVDILQERIAIITEAVKVVGVYDASADGVQRMLKEGTDNDLIPVDNWALFAEKGGIRGQVDWLPLVDIVNALDKLRELRSENIQLLQQITGMADIMRGDLSNQYEGVGQTQMKAQFGSVRVQALQDQFAQFASDLMALKAEVIAIHFDPQTIVKKSNMEHSPDLELLPQAVQLIKQPESARLRIKILPESMAMQDFARLKGERTDYLNALSTFMQSAAPLMESDPAAKPFLLHLLQWGLAGFKGSQEIEGVIDRAIEATMKEAANPKPDPEQAKMQQAMQLEQAKLQGEMQKIQAKSQADMAMRDQDRQADIETASAEHQMKIAEINASTQAKLTEIQAKMETDILVEQAQSAMNVEQAQATAGAEVQKDALSTQLELEKEVVKTRLKLEELAASSKAKIAEAKAKPKPSPAAKK
jgi:hypothetical protein